VGRSVALLLLSFKVSRFLRTLTKPCSALESSCGVRGFADPRTLETLRLALLRLLEKELSLRLLAFAILSDEKQSFPFLFLTFTE
jgi:hypothetical protein